ncbi:MAG: helix-turn-helix, Fis-type [Nitrobacter vulgaris]|nr:helix-turn-helix, Fis-type [Nitrobacter vulgaris]
MRNSDESRIVNDLVTISLQPCRWDGGLNPSAGRQPHFGKGPMNQEFQIKDQGSIQDQAALTPDAVIPLLVGSTVDEIERELVLQTLARCDGNRTRAARVLGVSVRTLRNKIRQYTTMGLDVPDHS